MLYSYRGGYPVDSLPYRIRLSNGLTKTDPATFTEEDISDAGFVQVESPPQSLTPKKVIWNSSDICWEEQEYSEAERKVQEAKEWAVIRNHTNELLKDSDILVIRSLESSGEVPEGLKIYRQALRDITNIDTPADIEWPIYEA